LGELPKRAYQGGLPSQQQVSIMSELSPGYHTIRGSDIRRDGMYLELIEESTGDEVAEVFYSDVIHKITISIFQSDMPLDIVELLLQRAKRELPPKEPA
jgi:hypothetical protein